MVDRTKEYIRIIQVFDRQNSTQSLQVTHHPLSTYARSAQKISDELYENETLVNNLSKIVNRKSMLNDPTSEINDITSVFKRGLNQITADLQKFQAVLSSSNKQQQDHYKIVRRALNSRMSKCAQTFQKSLEIRRTVLKAQSSRRSKFSHTGNSPMIQLNSPLFAPPPVKPAPPRAQNGNRLPPNHEQNLTTHPAPQSSSTRPMGLRRRGPGPEPGGGNYEPLHQSSNIGLQQDQQQRRHQSGQSAQARLQNANQVESTIVELSSMFSRMANMVAEQGEIVERIDDDMTWTKENVDAGQNELLKYFQTMSGNRSLIIKIFILLMVLIFLFTVVF